MPTETKVLARAMMAVLLACAFCLSGCADAADGPQYLPPSIDGPAFVGPPPSLTVDQASYIARGDTGVARERQWRFVMIATLRNNGDQVLYVETCGSRTPMYNVGSAGSAYEQMYACSGGEPGITLLPHAVRVDTLQIAGPTMFDGRTGAGFGATSGTIALSYTLATCLQVDMCRAGRFGVTSDPFSVTAQP